MPHGSHQHGNQNHSQHTQEESQKSKEGFLVEPKEEHKGHHHY